MECRRISLVTFNTPPNSASRKSLTASIDGATWMSVVSKFSWRSVSTRERAGPGSRAIGPVEGNRSSPLPSCFRCGVFNKSAGKSGEAFPIKVVGCPLKDQPE